MSEDALERLFSEAQAREQAELEQLMSEAENQERQTLERIFREAQAQDELEALFAEAEANERRELDALFREAAAAESPGVLTRTLQGVDDQQEKLSYRLEAISRRIDQFLGAERIYEEATETYLQTRGDVTYDRGGNWDIKAKVRLKLDLPKTKRRLKLLIESETDEENDPFNTGIATAEQVSDPSTNPADYSAALQFMLRESKRWRFSLEPGVKLRNPPEAFLRTRFVRTWKQTDWQLRATEIFGWYTEEGLRSETRLEVESLLAPRWFGRLTTKALWSEDYIAKRFVLSQSATLVQTLDRRRILAYDASVTGETEPRWRDLHYVTSVRYRQDIHRGWIFYEIRPFIFWDREEAFRRHPAITVSLELLFGARYLPGEDEL